MDGPLVARPSHYGNIGCGASNFVWYLLKHNNGMTGKIGKFGPSRANFAVFQAIKSQNA